MGEAHIARMTPSDCAICGPGLPARVRYEANFELADLTPDVFSARRVPDRIHYRLVQCLACGLVRSDPVLDTDSLHRLYTASTFGYAGEVDVLGATYARYLSKVLALGVARGSLLEIGCGNGFFLEAALDCGFKSVRGVEPSAAAVEMASERVRSGIVLDVMRPGLFDEATFDVICMFQVLDHLKEPGVVLEACLRVLRPGGLLLILNHDVEAASARILGERSPIIDVEHTYLYSPKTVARLVGNHGFVVVRQGPVVSTVRLRYLVRLTPLPPRLRRAFVSAMTVTRIGDVSIRAPLGNLYLIARKPQPEPGVFVQDHDASASRP